MGMGRGGEGSGSGKGRYYVLRLSVQMVIKSYSDSCRFGIRCSVKKGALELGAFMDRSEMWIA